MPAKTISRIKLPNNQVYDIKTSHSLTVGTKSFDGGQDVSITAADLGVDQAIRFVGRAAVNVQNHDTTPASQLGIPGYSVATSGDLIFNKDDGQELIWDGNRWEAMGNEEAWAPKDHIHATLTIGNYTYNGSQEVTIPVYDGETKL